ncbi:putative Peptidyl-prolyl cis-trans isomerase [Zostera marina]|uniref:Peptidyl-prolyl cis-trans isomerase n=1 Tax=Zostera marina TaxID=29655 RepID=A0A0K9PA53_ZOSMR|nr:putative Peptidyl-prolyl cis-trans isomerase [Zostera marina]
MGRIKPQALLLQSKKKKGPTKIGLTTIVTCNIFVILIVLSLYATYKHWYGRGSYELPNDLNKFEDGSLGETKKYDLPNFVIMNTSKGTITMELFKDTAPGVVDKFLDLCQKGYFKGMPFHRVIKNYVIQGGDLNKLGDAEDWTLKGKSNNQFVTSTKHEAFMLGTSKVKQGSKEFQLFITTAPIPDLNDNLIVFGRVVKGEDIVQEIEEVDTDERYRPKSAVGIIDIILKHEL